MTVEAGIVIGGVVVPKTEWVLRDSDAWWKAGDLGTRKRRLPIDLLVGHWTAGPTREGPSAARGVVRAMRARKRDDGSPLEVGIHFVISWDGIVSQTCDLAHATVHVGSASVNARSIGVECCWPGTIGHANALGVYGVAQQRMVAGKTAHVLRPSDELVHAWTRLADTLAQLSIATGVCIPRRVPSGTERFTVADQRAWVGAQEHWHVPGTTKIDAAGVLMDELRCVGWQLAEAA